MATTSSFRVWLPGATSPIEGSDPATVAAQVNAATGGAGASAAGTAAPTWPRLPPMVWPHYDRLSEAQFPFPLLHPSWAGGSQPATATAPGPAPTTPTDPGPAHDTPIPPAVEPPTTSPSLASIVDQIAGHSPPMQPAASDTTQQPAGQVYNPATQSYYTPGWPTEPGEWTTASDGTTYANWPGVRGSRLDQPSRWGPSVDWDTSIYGVGPDLMTRWSPDEGWLYSGNDWNNPGWVKAYNDNMAQGRVGVTGIIRPPGYETPDFASWYQNGPTQDQLTRGLAAGDFGFIDDVMRYGRAPAGFAPFGWAGSGDSRNLSTMLPSTFPLGDTHLNVPVPGVPWYQQDYWAWSPRAADGGSDSDG